MKNTVLAKVAINKQADEKVDTALVHINDGFEGGRVSKTDLMSWVLIRAIDSLDQTTINEIRRDHFNQVAYLDGLVKRLKGAQRNSLTDDERELLRNLLDTPMSKERRTRRTRSGENASVENQEKLI